MKSYRKLFRMKNKNKIEAINALENCRNYKIIQEIESILHYKENQMFYIDFFIIYLFLIFSVYNYQYLIEFML